MEDRGEGDPREVGEVGIGDPGDERVDYPQRPREGDPDEDNVDARENKVAHPKENRCKDNVEEEVKHKRQQDEQRQRALEILVADKTKRHGDNRIE